MRSRATSTEGKIPWRAWLLHDYARYWYAVTVLVLVVFGVGEFARRWQPLSAATVLALLLLTGAILFVGVAGYALLWRREGRAGRWLVGRARSLPWFLRKLGLRLRAKPSDPPSECRSEDDLEGGGSEDEVPVQAR